MEARGTSRIAASAIVLSSFFPIPRSLILSSSLLLPPRPPLALIPALAFVNPYVSRLLVFSVARPRRIIHRAAVESGAIISFKFRFAEDANVSSTSNEDYRRDGFAVIFQGCGGEWLAGGRLCRPRILWNTRFSCKDTVYSARLALSRAKNPGLIISPGRGGEPLARMAHDPPGEHRFACCPMRVSTRKG